MNAFMRSDLILKREASTSALVTSKGELSLPVPLRFERTARQFVSGEAQHTCVEEACYSQLLEFYFCGTGRLSRFLDYSTLFAESAFPVRPEEVSVVLTKLCNMTCVHCYNDSGRKDSGELSDEQKIGLIEYLCRWGIRRLTITGGEPTLDPVLPACLDLATAFGVGVKLSTNGWHLSEAVLSSIRRKQSNNSTSVLTALMPSPMTPLETNQVASSG